MCVHTLCAAHLKSSMWEQFYSTMQCDDSLGKVGLSAIAQA